ncbi:hypothetical protein LTR28_006369 [Elasticomyces elasticus]|nr:hypothetical protein LTR28_006369 [Elasticomyces elasticus]
MLELSEAAGVIEVELSEPPEGSAMELELEELNEIAGVVEAELPDPVEDSPIKLEPLELIEADEAAEAVPSEEIEEARARTELPNVEEEVTTKAGLLLVVDDEKATNELLKLGDAEEAINVVKLPLDLAREGDETGLLGGVKDEETTEVEMLLNVDSKDMVVDELPELKEAEETTKVELSRDEETTEAELLLNVDDREAGAGRLLEPSGAGEIAKVEPPRDVDRKKDVVELLDFGEEVTTKFELLLVLDDREPATSDELLELSEVGEVVKLELLRNVDKERDRIELLLDLEEEGKPEVEQLLSVDFGEAVTAELLELSEAGDVTNVELLKDVGTE